MKPIPVTKTCDVAMLLLSHGTCIDQMTMDLSETQISWSPFLYNDLMHTCVYIRGGFQFSLNFPARSLPNFSHHLKVNGGSLQTSHAGLVHIILSCTYSLVPFLHLGLVRLQFAETLHNMFTLLRIEPWPPHRWQE